MKRLTIHSLSLLGALFLQPLAAPAQEAPEPPATIVVDWTRATGTVNRPLFSLQGFMQVVDQPDPMVMQTFLLTNPQGTQTRLEIWPHLMEPENDNDDPHTIDWDRMHPDKMIRFIPDTDSFLHLVEEDLGMESLALITYNNAEWMKSDDPEKPVADHDEWAEFAAAVVETFNGRTPEDYRPRMRLAQIWNEPNMPHFYGGTMETYFDLFNTVADRLHADYPGVMVGGPNISRAWHTEPDKWVDEFIAHCGTRADYIVFHHYGPRGEGTGILESEVRKRAEQFRAIPGKEQGKVMITETDAWFHGWPKAQFIFERQFRFLDLSDLILGIHHFCAMAYNEAGNYTFGVVREQGGVMPGVFWPYWLFRNLIGDHAHVLRTGERAADIDVAASHHEQDGSWIATAVLRNRTEGPISSRTMLYFPPSVQDRVLAIERVREDYNGIAEVHRVAAGEHQHRLDLEFAPGEGIGLQLRDSGARHFAFRDLNNQEFPWIGLTTTTRYINLGESFDLRADILNTTFDSVSGRLVLAGIPSDWPVEVVDGSDRVDVLGFGSRRGATFRVTVSSLDVMGEIGPYVYLDQGGEARDLDRIAHSIPVTLDVVQPVVTTVLPSPVHAVPGEENQVTLQLRSQVARPVEVAIAITTPEGIATPDANLTVTLAPKEQRRLHFPLQVSADAAAGSRKASITTSFFGEKIEDSYSVVVTGEPIRRDAVPLDLTNYLNFDPTSFWNDREDYDKEMGMFIFPADYTPSGRILRVRGVPWRMPALDKGQKNAVRPQGQVIAVPAGNYRGVGLIGFGHSGKHPLDIVLRYSDGSTQTIATQIPEWCTPPPPGMQVAFTAPHRYTPGGTADPPCELFTWTLDADPEKQLAAIELPTIKDAYLFGITLLP